MTLTWVLVSAIAACALILFVLLFAPRRHTGKDGGGSAVTARRWVDAVAAAAPMIAALIIGVFGMLIAQRVIESQDERAALDRQQLTSPGRDRERNEQMERRLNAIEKFLPLLSRSEQDKSAALLAIRATGDFELAATLAGLFPSSGSVMALETIARQAEPYERQPAVRALGAMNTEESGAALSRVYDDVIRALVAFDGEGSGAAPPNKVVAGVVWSEQWLFVPLGPLGSARPRNQLGAEERGRQTHGDGLTRFRLAMPPPPGVQRSSIQFSSTPPEHGEAVFAIGLDAEGHAMHPRLGVVDRIVDGALVAQFGRAVPQVAGSLLVLPTGVAVGMLSHEQPLTNSARYIPANAILAWFEQLEREAPNRRQRD